MPLNSSCEAFIAQLYRSTQNIDLGHFRQWALEGLRAQIDYDAALWSSGHLSTRSFHTHTIIGLPEDYPQRLIEALPINPISKALFSRPEQPVDMADVIDDEGFYQSEIYLNLFGPLGIERILSSLHIDSRSGIYTLLTLYRGDRERVFSQEEKNRHHRLLYHLLQAASQACLNHLHTPAPHTTLTHAAIVDGHGIYHEVAPGFLDLIEEHYPHHTAQALPFTVPKTEPESMIGQLIVHTQRYGDLWRIELRPVEAFDQLTQREREVIEAVTQGLSFKQVARELGLSPSTVSNHLYRVYQKLNINNRSELADLLRQSRSPQA